MVNPPNRPGKVYLVGAGPGDPGLLTLKGQHCLGLADVVLYDGLVNPLILRHTRADARRTCRVGDRGERHLDQEQINAELIAQARAGHTVVRLKGGDPFIFGRGSEEAAALAEAGIPFEVVPGVTAAIAAAEYAGISLTHRELASSVAFVTGHEDPSKPATALDYEVLARFPGTLVFYMGLHRIAAITGALLAEGKSASTPVAVISRGSTPAHRTVTGTLTDIAERVAQAKLRPPSLIIVGECVTQRERINWFEKLPLAGVTIGITRPIGQQDQAIEQALALGAQPVLMPTMEILPARDMTVVDRALSQLREYQWVIFTSVNAVDAFFARLETLNLDCRALGGARIAAIGPSTGDRLRACGIRADVVPAEFRGEALAAELAPHVAGQRVLWPRANRGRDVLPQLLTAAGASVDEVVIYEHHEFSELPVAAQTLLASGELRWVALSSPSIARAVANLIPPPQRESIRFAAISPVTAEAALEAGLVVDATAAEFTWPGLFAAILATERASVE